MKTTPPPQNLEAEQSTLGSMLMDFIAVERVLEILDPEDFYPEGHQRIFASMRGLIERDEPVDLVTVANDLRERKLLDAVGGAAYLTVLLDSVPTAANAEFHARIVRDMADRRRAIEKAKAALADLEAGADIPASLDFASRRRERIEPKTATAAELLAKTIPPARWIVQGILPEGLTVIGGKSKTGKSWFAIGIGIAVASGGMALGCIPVERGDVLYITVDDPNERRLQDRLRTILRGSEPPEGFHYAQEWKRFGEGGEIELERFLSEHPGTRLVVIDIFGKVRKRSRANGNNTYDDDSEAMTYFKRIADERGIAILLIHHCRKTPSPDGDPMDEILGSMGVTGGVDTAMVLKRGRGSRDAVLHLVGRDIDDDEPLALEFEEDGCLWILRGKASEVQRTKERAKVLDLLEERSEPLTPKECGEALEMTHDAMKKLLPRMARDGEIAKVGYGKYQSTKPRPSYPSIPLDAESADSRRDND